MKGRRFAAVLLVLSMLLMLVPMQAFAEDGVVPETSAVSTVSEAAVTAESTVPEEAVTAESTVQTVSEANVTVPETVPGAETEAVSAEEETAAEETAEPETEAREAADAVESTSEEAAVVAASSEEETVQSEAALAGETDLAQMTFSGTTSGVTWGDASSTVDANGVRTVMFTATIPEGTTADELNLNVCNSGNLSALSNTDALIQYVVNVTDNTKSYQFKANSGAVALADGTGAVAATVSSADAANVMLGASASGSFAGADTYLTTSGEGNGFNTILQEQWKTGESSQILSYYQQNQSNLYPVVQFKLTKTDTAAAAASSSTAAETDDLSGSVPLTVKKVLSGQILQADQFTFELKDENGNVLQTKKNAQDGTIPFDALNFTQNDIGEHKYTINEVMPEGAKADSNGKIVVDNIEYDTHTESVTITISLNEEGKLKATVRQSTTELTFTNKYVGTASSTTSSTTSRTSPATGDSTPIMPYISMLTGAFLALVLSKRLIRAYAKH